MNERIEKLAEQAGIYKLNLSDETEYWIMEKFAELIVKECMDVAYDHTPNSEDCEYKRLIHNKIKEHFGVEE
jgi:hypothetical protein